MFASWKEKRAEKKSKDQAIRQSQYWKTHPKMQNCLRAMRGSCTLAPVEMHEAAIAVVNIALREGSWTSQTEIPADFMEDTVFIVWTDEKLPVLKAPWDLAKDTLPDITAVAESTFLVSETLDRILHFPAPGEVRMYSIAP